MREAGEEEEEWVDLGLEGGHIKQGVPPLGEEVLHN